MDIRGPLTLATLFSSRERVIEENLISNQTFFKFLIIILICPILPLGVLD